MVSLAENARMPVDNPATHLELTMIHEALILEYSGRHLALHRMGRRAQAVRLLVHRASRSSSPGASPRPATAWRCCWRCRCWWQARRRRLLPRADRDDHRQDAHLPRAGVPRHRVPAGACSACSSTSCWGRDDEHRSRTQLVNLFAAVLLLLAFAMLAQRRILAADPPVHAAGPGARGLAP